MATTSRDAKLVLSVESLGQDNITKLEKALRDLAATGDASSAEFGDLADQIGRLGSQNDALQAVKALAADTDTLNQKQAQAADTASTLAEKLGTLRAATVEAKTAQEAARTALVQGEQAYTQAGNALRTLRAEYDAAGKNTAEYRTRLQQLVAEQNAANLALVTLRENNRQANAAVREATAEQGKAEGAYKRVAKQLSAATEAADANAKALSVASSEAQKLGVDASNLADAETKLIATFTQASDAANRRRQALQEMAEADRLAAREAETMAAMLKRGEAALWAEEAALREAAQGARAYAAAKEKAAADAAAWQKEADNIVAVTHAQQAATKATEKQIEKLRELAANDAFEKQAADARKMVQATEYTRFWADALDEADRKQRQLAESTKKVNDAFVQINVRPIEQVQQEIEATNAAMNTLAASGKLTGGALAVAMAQGQTKVEALQREMRQLTGAMTVADKAANLLKNSMGQIAAGNLIADGIGYLINKVKELGLGFVTTIADAEKLRRALNAIYKDSNLTAQQMEFLRSTAVGAGVAVGDLSAPFIKFAAATKSANIPLAETNALFAAVTRASGTLSLSGEQVGGMLEALSQMASKGVVSMEELRQQLGDRLPGALSLVAKGLGLTEAQLIKLVESGQLAARDLFPALTKSLQEMQGEVSGLNVTWQNFKNVLTGVAQDAGDAGWVQILTGALKFLGGTVGVLALGLSTVWEAMRLVGVGAVALAATLRGEGAQAWGYFNEQVDISLDRLTKQNDRLTAMLDPASEAAERMRQLAKAQGQVSAEAQKSAANIDEYAAKIDGTAKSGEHLATITKILSNTQTDLGARIVKINSITAERLELLEKEVIAAEKQAKAVKIQGDATVTMTQLRNSEVETLRAQAEATENNLAAAQKAAEAQRTVTAVLTDQRNALVELAKQEATGLAGREKEIQALDKKLTQSRAELEQSDATVAALKQESAARQQAILVLQDNSAQLAQFKDAAAAAEATVILYKDALDRGLVSQEAYTKAQEQAAKAVGLYRDALSDLAAKTQAQAALDQANIAVKQAGLSVQQQAYEQLAAAARATGDLTLATHYEVEAKRIQIQITKAVAEAKQLEVKAARAAVEAERSQLETNGQLTEAKKLELEARLANIKAKEIEAGASASIIRALEAEIQAIQNGVNARNNSAGSIDRETSSISANISERERSIATREKEIELQEREVALREKERQGSATMTNELGTRTGIVNFLKQMGVTDENTAKRIANEFADNQGNVVYSNNAGQLKYGGAGSTLSEAVAKAAEQWLYSEAGMQASAKKNEVAPTTTPDTTGTTTSGAGTQSSNPGKTLNINLGGRTTRVNVASDADANNLVGLLRQLENDGSTAA